MGDRIDIIKCKKCGKRFRYNEVMIAGKLVCICKYCGENYPIIDIK